MLFACHDIMCGMLELAPAHVKNTPVYCAATPGAQPIIAKPRIVMAAFPAIIGPRMWYLSPTQAVENMTIPAKASAGNGVRMVVDWSMRVVKTYTEVPRDTVPRQH